MGHRSQQQYTTLTFISSSECIAWLTVYGIEAVAIIVLNALTAIIYLKVHSLRKRRMYLVISLAVADMFVGGLLIFDGWFLGRDCNFWTSDLNRPSNFVVIALFRLVPLASLTYVSFCSARFPGPFFVICLLLSKNTPFFSKNNGSNEG